MKKMILSFILIFTQLSAAEYDEDRADRRVDVRLESIMTPNEMAKTGVGRLNPQERRQLEIWLSRWSIEMMNRGVERSNVYRVTDIESRGELIHLNDGSTYRVSPFEQQKSRRWDVDNRIEVRGEKNSLRPYRLVNLDKNTSVGAELVRFRDKKPRREFNEIEFKNEEILPNTEESIPETEPALPTNESGGGIEVPLSN